MHVSIRVEVRSHVVGLLNFYLSAILLAFRFRNKLVRQLFSVNSRLKGNFGEVFQLGHLSKEKVKRLERKEGLGIMKCSVTYSVVLGDKKGFFLAVVLNVVVDGHEYAVGSKRCSHNVILFGELGNKVGVVPQDAGSQEQQYFSVYVVCVLHSLLRLQELSERRRPTSQKQDTLRGESELLTSTISSSRDALSEYGSYLLTLPGEKGHSLTQGNSSLLGSFFCSAIFYIAFCF